MTYTKEELWALLEHSDVIINLNGKYLINDVFLKAIKGKTSTTRSGYCTGYLESYKGLSDGTIYKKFMEECDIPLMYKGDISYFVRTETKDSIKGLKAILQNPEIDYSTLVNKITAFYRAGVAIPGFAKFITSGTWETIYGAREDTTVS